MIILSYLVLRILYRMWQEAEGGEQHLWRLSQVEGLDQHQEGTVSTRINPIRLCKPIVILPCIYKLFEAISSYKALYSYIRLYMSLYKPIGWALQGGGYRPPPLGEGGVEG